MMVGMGQDTLASMFTRGGGLFYPEPPSTSGIVTPAAPIEMATGPTISIPVAPAPVSPVVIATNPDIPPTVAIPPIITDPVPIPPPNSSTVVQAQPTGGVLMPSAVSQNVQVAAVASSTSLSDWFSQNQTLALAGGAILLLLLLGGRR
jgi:hypothetical protein